ncbi:hypothetical protein N7527_008417 [Penicillium freii]|nr:hypothetical protein N7527_008417 [Penicillium freii]
MACPGALWNINVEHIPGSPYTSSYTSPAVGTARWTDPTLITPGSYLTSKTMDEEEMFAAEKVALLKHLARIERETGWDTSARAANLRSLWGLG